MGRLARLELFNGQHVPRADMPRLDMEDFDESILTALENGCRLSALFALPDKDKLQLIATLADVNAGGFALISTVVSGDSYTALTPSCPAAHLFEREIAEQWGVVPIVHPWLKPVRFHRSYSPGRDAWGRGSSDAIDPGVTDFFSMAGDEAHEVAVGPVHAGVIEPGHFRFSCHGENVYHLEVSQGYQHRGVERALVGGPNMRTRHLIETLAGDTTIGHATAYSQLIEGLTGIQPPPHADVVRGIALELERMANHVGDLGALAGDVGFLPTAAYCGRLRGDFLNLTALICGNRFGRGLVRPGGVGFSLEGERARELSDRLERIMKDVKEAIELLFDTPSVLARFESTGTVSGELAAEIGLVGPAARASGLERDARLEFPTGIYRFAQLPVTTWRSGDVFARAWVRWHEVQRSAAFIAEQLSSLPEIEQNQPIGPLTPDAIAVSVVEGWRGEICHVALTNNEGRFARYKVVDPSFHNWKGLELAMRNQAISDFPLCNKSFNLSYCGCDL